MSDWNDDEFLHGKTEAFRALLEIYRDFLTIGVDPIDLDELETVIKERMTGSPEMTRNESQENGWERAFNLQLDCINDVRKTGARISALGLLRLVRTNSAQLKGVTEELLQKMDRMIQNLEGAAQ